jgi:PAS domain S-box-containing protein
VSAPGQPFTPPSTGGPGGRPPAILIVDDNDNKRTALKAVLQPLGYSIVEADSGIAALRCLAVQDFAVILLDVQMPEMDGFETAALIRLRQQCELTPIIFVTAFEIDDIETDRYAQGAVDFMFAPFKPEELRAKVSVFGNMYAKADVLAARAREVQMSADQLRLLTDSAPIGIFQTDAANRYVYTNPRWAQIVGMSCDEAAGQHWDVIMHTDRREALRVDLARADVGTEVCHRFELGTPGAGARTVLVTSTSMHDSDGAPTGWVGTLSDVTAEVGAEAAMADAVGKATEASRLKSDFLANMSHEIRTPMNGVLGMTDLLLETALDARQRDYAQTVRNSGEALLAIINDILDFSKVEAGMLDLETVDFDVRAIVHGVVDLLATSAQGKGIELMAVVVSTVPAVVSGDPGRVRQVLTNLVHNALKFTQQGEVVVRVSGTDAGEGICELRFEVTDTGPGIPADKLSMIFQPFVQADTSTARRHGGTGLGLAISSQLVALMHGACGVSSRPGAGSTFWFTLAVGAEPGQATPQVLLPDPDLAGISVLVVDDNATSRRSLSRYLSDWGMVVATADTASAALAHLRTAAEAGRPVAIALVDQSISDLDGSDLAGPVDEGPATTTRLVLMTDLGEERHVPETACGALSKPVRPEDLRRCLRAAAGFEVSDVVVPKGKSRGPVEPVAGRLLLVEDNVINQKVAVAILTGVGYQVDIAPDGAAAVRAVAAGEYDAILMDCQMPEMNGYEATIAIRAMEGAGRHTPILAMTAGVRPEERQRCLAAGMDGYLAKPVNRALLLSKVAHFLTPRPVQPARLLQVEPSSPTCARASAVDSAVIAELRVLSQDADPDFLPELVRQFVADTDTRLDQLRGALDAGDSGSAGALAHSIKGSSGAVGGRGLALSCGRLEKKANAGHLAAGQGELREVEDEYDELRRTLAEQLLTPL